MCSAILLEFPSPLSLPLSSRSVLYHLLFLQNTTPPALLSHSYVSSISPKKKKRNNHRTEILDVSSIPFLTHPPLFPYILVLVLLIRMDGSTCSLDPIYVFLLKDIIPGIIPSFTVLFLCLCPLLILYFFH